jgi:amidase
MKRRFFFKNTMAAGALLSVSGCQPAPPEERQEPLVFDDFKLNETNIRELGEAYSNGSMTCEKVTQLYLDRIDKIDKNGPELNSVIELNPDALQIARALDDEMKDGKIRSPLHGIPIMLKDNIDTAGKMMTTAGSLALEGNYAAQNAWVAQKLEEAGAVIIGKTNLSEWANFRSLRSSSGWSGRGGQTKNPYITDRNPCGSSSGSGVAVSANLCVAAIGTETNGSIVCPSSINGIVGIKPPVGLISRAGIIPISHTHDTAGPMCRSVEDAAILLGALTGVDKNDEYTNKSTGKSFTDYTQFLNKDSLRNKRLGIATNYTGFHSEVDKLLEKATSDLRDLGALVVEISKDDLNNVSDHDAYNVLLIEFKNDLNAYLRNCNSAVKSRTLEELIKFNIEHSEHEMPFFDQEIFLAAQQKGDYDSGEYKNALENVLRSTGPEGIDKVLGKYELDAIIAPTGAPAWPTDVINGDHYVGGSSSPAARSGYPNITLPMGFIHGLPVGISFFAGAFSEPKLIGFAYAFEQATKHRKAPEFILTFNYQLESNFQTAL